MADDKPRRYKPSEQPKGWAIKKKAKKKKPAATVTMGSVIRGGKKDDTVSGGGNPGTKKKPKSTAKKINKEDIPKSVRDEVDAHFRKLKAQGK